MRNKMILISMQISLLFFLSLNAKVALSDEPFIGEVRWFSGNFAPRGWASCNGQLLAINQNQALFSLLGTTYGGDGRTTFALPDMRGRSMLHNNYSNFRLGAKGGAEAITLDNTELPAHSHTLRADNGGGDSISPNDRVISKAGRLNTFDSTANVDMESSAISSTGGNLAHNNMQPFVTATCIIALQGIFPSRN